MTESFDTRLNAFYRSDSSRAQIDNIYDDWAKDYDRQNWASGNPYIGAMTGLAGRYIEDRNARILDAGCGSGLLAHMLQIIGFSNIIGIDASEGMLEAAAAKDCYAELHKMLVGERIDLPQESFDAVTAAGVLTLGHAPPESLQGLIGVAKPGAPIIFSISKPAAEDLGFNGEIDRLEREGLWRLEEKTDPFVSFPYVEGYEEMRHWICVYRKSS